MVFWTPVAEDGLPVFDRILEPLGLRVWDAVAANLTGAALPLNRPDVVGDTVLRCSALLADPIYQRFLSLKKAHSLVSRPFHFTAFEDDLLDGGLDILLDRRRPLRRLLGRVLDNAVVAWTEIATAIAHDRPLLAREGLVQSPAEGVEHVNPGASDLHDRGRSATKVLFASGDLLYYKPRSGSADLVWNAMLDEVGASLGIDLPTTNLVDRGTHYWTSAIEPSTQRDSLEHYYTQLGVLTFLIFLFQGIDFHCENFIATGCGPIVLDLEGLLHPTEVPRRSLDSATAEAFSTLVTSVVNTGLLPCCIEGDEQASVGAINPPIEARSRRIVATKARTGEMRFESHEFSDYWTAHTPLLPGQRFEDEWIRAVSSGFRVAYRACHAGGLDRTIQATLDALRDVELRFIARPTAYYYNALHKLLSTLYEAQEVDEYDVLSRYLRTLPDYGVGDDLVDLEAEALAQFDIPRFIRPGGGLSVKLAGSRVVQLDRPSPPIESSVKRYRRLSTADLRVQESLLSASFGGLRRTTPMDSGPGGLLSSSDMLDLAVECGRTVLAASVRSERTIAWLVATPVSSQQRTTMAVCGIDLYAGLSGIAVFLGELYQATGETEFREAAIRCVETVRQRLEVEHSGLGIGGGTGVGGILYAMSCLSASLPESCAPDIASQLCGDLSSEIISADKSFDIIDGSAGLLLGLISLRSTQCYESYEAACVETLLAALVEAERQGLRSWQTFELGRCYSGMAHGSSGIAMALARRYALSQSAELLRAIETGLAFDESVDFASEGMPVQWCHGAPGIALAHWAIGQYIPDDARRVRTSMDHVRAQIVLGPESRTDGVCCGAMSRAAALFHTGGPNGLSERPWQALVAAVCRGRQRAATFRWSAGSDSLNPGLFVGLGGIGLELLRMRSGEMGISPLLFT